MIPTCVSIPDICHPILTTREDEVPTWCESAINPLSVVCGSDVLFHSQAERSNGFKCVLQKFKKEEKKVFGL